MSFPIEHSSCHAECLGGSMAVYLLLLLFVCACTSEGQSSSFNVNARLGYNYVGYTTGGRFQCPPGWWMLFGRCDDVNECLGGGGIHARPCPGSNTVCRNTIGSFRCECRRGHTGDAYTYQGCAPVSCPTSTTEPVSTTTSTTTVTTTTVTTTVTTTDNAATDVMGATDSTDAGSTSSSDSSGTVGQTTSTSVISSTTSTPSTSTGSSADTSTPTGASTSETTTSGPPATNTVTSPGSSTNQGTSPVSSTSEVTSPGSSTNQVTSPGSSTNQVTSTESSTTELSASSTNQATSTMSSTSETTTAPSIDIADIPAGYERCLHPQLSNGSFYRRVGTTPSNWQRANVQCAADHPRSRLAKITSNLINMCIGRQLLFASVNQPSWIGLRFSDGAFRWTDDEEVGFDNWAAGEPSTSVDGVCAVIRLQGSLWRVQRCSETLANFFCEIPI